VYAVPSRYNGKIKQHAQRRKYCSAIVNVPNPNRICKQHCNSRDVKCRKHRTRCVKAREERGMDPFSNRPLNDRSQTETICRPKNIRTHEQRRQQQQARTKALDEAQKKYAAQLRRPCKGTRRRRKRCFAGRRSLFQAVKKIRDDALYDPRAPCKTGFREVGGEQVEYDYETGEEVAPVDYNAGGQTDGMRGLNGDEEGQPPNGSNPDDYYNSMVEMMEMFDEAYGGAAMEAAIEKAEQAGNGNSVGRNDDTDSIAHSSVAADNMF